MIFIKFRHLQHISAKVFERSLNRYVANESEFISTNSSQFRNIYLKPDSLFHLILFR